MPRIPTRDSLRQGVLRSTGGIVRPPRDFVGGALESAGNLVASEAGKALKKERKQQTALELAKARAEWSTSLLTEQSSYTLDQNPNYETWTKKYETRSPVWQQRAAENISDPEIRQQFIHETEDDRVRVGLGINKNARNTANKARLTAAETSLDQLVSNAASQSGEDASGTMRDIRATLEGLVEAGLITPEEAAQRSIDYGRKYASIKVQQDLISDPVAAFQNLSGEGGGAPKYYGFLDAGNRITLTRAAKRLAKRRTDELDKVRRIDDARSVVDFATENFTDRAKAQEYIKTAVDDPKDREATLRMWDAENRRNDAADRQRRKDDFETVFGAVTQAIETGDADAAMKAIPADMNAQDKAALKDLVLKGPARVDDSAVLVELTAMRMSSPAEFAELDLRKFQTKLSQPTIERLFAQQNALKKPEKQFSKFTSLKNANQMVTQSLSESGILTTAKATVVDRRYARHVQSLVSSEIEEREEELQRPLRATELQEVVDGVFMSFKGPDVGWFSTSEKAWTIKDVLDQFTELEDDSDGNILPGQLLDMATRDFRKNAPNTPITPQMLYQWQQMFVNRKQSQAN